MRRQVLWPKITSVCTSTGRQESREDDLYATSQMLKLKKNNESICTGRLIKTGPKKSLITLDFKNGFLKTKSL